MNKEEKPKSVFGEIFIPKIYICSVCGETAINNMDYISYHRKHNGKLIPKEII